MSISPVENDKGIEDKIYLINNHIQRLQPRPRSFHVLKFFGSRVNNITNNSLPYPQNCYSKKAFEKWISNRNLSQNIDLPM